MLYANASIEAISKTDIPKLLMHIEKKLIAVIQQAFQQSCGLALSLSDLSLQATHQSFEGDYTFVTFPFAKRCQQQPKEIAHQLGAWIKMHYDWVTAFNVVQGFLNLTLADRMWIEQLVAIESTSLGWGGTKAAKIFTRRERGANKCPYSWRAVFGGWW